MAADPTLTADLRALEDALLTLRGLKRMGPHRDFLLDEIRRIHARLPATLPSAVVCSDTELLTRVLTLLEQAKADEAALALGGAFTRGVVERALRVAGRG